PGLEAARLAIAQLRVAPDHVVAVDEPPHRAAGLAEIVLAPRQRERATGEEAVEAGAALAGGGQAAEFAGLRGQAGAEALREADPHQVEDARGGRLARHAGVVSQQPLDVWIALDVRERQRAVGGER